MPNCELGIRVRLKHIARLMRMASICGVSHIRSVRTTRRSVKAEKAPNLVCRDFTSKATETTWVVIITDVPTHEGILYLSVVIDAFSRRVVSWSIANHM